MHALVKSEAGQVARERRVRFEFDAPMITEPVLCDPALVDALRQAMEAAG